MPRTISFREAVPTPPQEMVKEMRGLSEPRQIYVARGYFFLLYSFTIDITLWKCFKGFKVLAFYWDLLASLWKPELLHKTWGSSRKVIPKFTLQMWILFKKKNSTNKWIVYVITQKNPLMNMPRRRIPWNKAKGSFLFLPSTSSLYPSFHTNTYQGSFWEEKKGSRREQRKPQRGILWMRWTSPSNVAFLERKSRSRLHRQWI